MNITSTVTHYKKDQDHLNLEFLLAVWFFIITVMALNDIFVGVPGEAPIAILASFATTFSLFAVAYITSPSFREYILALDMRFLIMLHAWRMIGMGFVMLHLYGHLPGLFAYLAGFGDALTAIVALFLAYALFTRHHGVSKKWIERWNTFGLLDFVIAVSVGVLTRTDALLAPANGVSSDLMTTFPFVLIPGFFVQMYALTHIIIYLQLMNNHSK